MTLRYVSYLFIVLQGIIIISASFVDTGLFNSEFQTFSAWFALSLFSFCCGWLIDKMFGWKTGGKLMFSVTVAGALLNIFIISFFEEYFSHRSILVEDLILFTLRSFVLGAFGFFGMTLADYFILQKKADTAIASKEEYEKKVSISEREADIIIKEAKLKAEQIIFEADKKSSEILRRKTEVEKQLRSIINLEKELIKKYESE